ncbi:MAG: hypothetical protein AVDCRST_MAG68-3875 [uncultured Gemmatimonadetes bacterium]|uniref:Uncharacterized protein n=1 Tax=uncultured Gemmatimonadota bacterium TaxID=203437 RepID=A0A6J4MAY6_9BACT|nr:MAG: hypothetical protein AVDCRST_MAG68-3875 [uncultured Gemmatimonadota bacterium]
MLTRLRPRLAGAVFLLAGAALPARAQRDSAAFVTTYGSDTVSVERWVRDGSRWEAAVLDRSPVALLRRYSVELNRSGRVQRFEERWHNAGDPTGAPTRTLVLEPAPGGWIGRITEYGSTREGMVAGDPAALPYRYREHWPLELAMSRVRPGAARTLPMLDRLEVIPVMLERGAGGEVRVVQERRAPYVARVDEAGNIQGVHIPMVPRDLVVTRAPWMEIDERARRWQAGQFRPLALGELSGGGVARANEFGGTAGPPRAAAPSRKREEAAVGGARIVVEYGKATLRGRESWGGAVPWGQVWSTGGGEPARLTTTRELVLGDPARRTLSLPPGEYTLQSIHEQGSGVLVVSRGTEELGRVPARRVQRVFAEDEFIVEVDPGAIRLIWGESEYVVPFTVR